MVRISEQEGGLVLPVRAQPHARKSGVQGETGGALKVAVTAPAEDGRANAALLEVLAEALKIRRSQLELIAGQTSRDKRFLIRGLSRADLEQTLAGLLRR